MNRKKNIQNLVTVVIVIALSTAFILPGPMVTGDTFVEKENTIALSPVHVRELLETTKGVLLVDVRSVEDYEACHLVDAVSIPLSSLACSSCLQRKLEKYTEEYNGFIVYCTDGSRSKQGYDVILGKGFAYGYILDGGLNAWVAQVFPVIEHQQQSEERVVQEKQYNLVKDISVLPALFPFYKRVQPLFSLPTAQVSPPLSNEDIEALRKQGETEGWTFTVDENEATHRPLDELCGLVVPENWWEKARFDPCTSTRDLPTAYDWREHSGYLPVRNQGGCGSCWAFGTVGPLEYNILIQDGIRVDLSEQWLVSCNRDGWGCNGGWWAHNYHEWKTDRCGGTGAVLESDFPYSGTDKPCSCPYPHAYWINDWAFIGNDHSVPSVDAIKQAILDYGPVSAAVYIGGAFSAYDEGVFNTCGSGEVNHAVVLVGWDDYYEWQGEEYGVWILRNSWGSGWGENGYMWITYGCSSIGYAACYVDYDFSDCNNNGIPDACDIACGSSGEFCDIPGCGGSSDCNENGVPDECESGYGLDCNNNGLSDFCDIYSGFSEDCNGNGVPDECDIAQGTSSDINDNGIPDECEPDCNGNGLPDDYDIFMGTSNDINSNGVPDECDSDCNENGLPDDYDIFMGTSNDINSNGVPDECEPDCNGNGWPDDYDILMGLSNDINGNGVPDECDSDCNENGLPDDYDIAQGTSADCNKNGVPDECDIALGTSMDCNTNDVPDECELLVPPVDAVAQDLCAYAELVCMGVWYYGSTSSATNDGSVSCGSSTTSPDVWYYYKPYGSGYLTISLATSSYDTVVSVHTGCPGTESNEIGCNDDYYGLQSRLDVLVQNGQEYWIRISGKNGATGNFQMLLIGPACMFTNDCNNNGVLDECDIASGTSTDFNGNGIPDECDGLGDMNCDGVVNTFDIDPFVLALLYPDQYMNAYPECGIIHGDNNGDGMINVFDVDLFVQLLTGG